MSSIREYFAGRSILLTGGTGFLGKALLEKILRDLPDVARIYVLVRPGGAPAGSAGGVRGKRPGDPRQAAAERLRREIFETAIFSRLRQAHGERFSAVLEDKIVPVPGDLTEEADLGIPGPLLESIRAYVDVVIHGAASVFFDERIDHAVEMNTLGPRRLIDLARTFRTPPVFTFVSTAYVSGNRTGSVPEVPPDPRRSAAELAGKGGGAVPSLDIQREIAEIQAFTRRVHAEAGARAGRFRDEAQVLLASAEPGETVESLATAASSRWLERRLVEEGMRRARRLGWHEVYTFTKAMGEAQVVTHRGDLPTALVRPSIIESSLAEPEPGWINGLKVADPLIAGYAKGRIPDFPGSRDSVLDLIPVDFVANAILAATARTARERGITVYHVATGSRNPVRVGECFDLMQAYYRRHPMRDRNGEPIRARDWSFPATPWFRAKYRFGVRLPLRAAAAAVRATPVLPWPAGLADRLGRGAEAVERLLYYTDIYSPYTSHGCSFESTNTKRLFDGLSPEDRKTFNFDVEAIHWPAYIQDIHLSGLDRHVLRFGRTEGAQGRRRSGSGKPRVSTEDLRTLPDLLRLSADRFGDKVALQVKRDGNWVRLTYRDLLRRAGLMGALWRRERLRRGDRVVLLSENQPEWAVAYMAAQSLGLTVVPIDVHTPPAEVDQIVAFTEARAVLTTATLYPGLPKSLRSSPLPIWDVTDDGMPFVERGQPRPASASPDEVRWEDQSPDDVASIIFTSGPAVDPRGVMLTHRNFLANLLSLSEALRSYETDRFISVLPLHHALEFTGGLLMPLFSGALVTYAQTLKSKVILDLMEETGASAILAVPRIFEMLLDRLRRGGGDAMPGREPAERSPELVSFVNRTRMLVSGGAPLDHTIFEGFAELGTPIHEGYGLTETAPILTVNPLWGIRPRSVGRALPGVELRIDRPDASGEGEIVVRGPNVMKGYLKNPEATAKVLRDGWLYTGDLGRTDADGYVTITGRSKELIVTGAGKNVWPEEVELFYRPVGGVRELAVFGVREPAATRETVHAAVVADGDRDTVLEAIHHVSHERPTYQRVQFVHFWDGPLPRQPGSDRVDRAELRRFALDKIRDAKRAKRTPVAAGADEPWWRRETLALVGRIAGRAPDEPVTPRESLAQLLDSLQSVELLAALEGRFGASIPDEEAASLRTVADVLERVRAAAGERETPTPAGAAASGDYWARALASDAASPARDELRASPAIGVLQTAFLAAASLALRTVFRMSVRGLDRLPARTPYLLAANHSSHLDTLAMLAALRGRTRRIHVLGARDYFFNTPARAWFFRNFLNVVPFDREKNFVEGLRACRQVLRADEPVLIFPEGTRSPNGRLQPFKVGLGILALELGVPVVPARIRGTYEAWPKGARLPEPHRIDVAFGEPVAMDAYRARRGAAGSYDLYREVVNEVRQRLERLLEES